MSSMILHENSVIHSLIGYVVIMNERGRFGNGAPIADRLLCCVWWSGGAWLGGKTEMMDVICQRGDKYK